MKDPVGILLMRWRNRVILPLIRGNVLDVGCGTNTLIQEYRRRTPHFQCTGIDVYPWKGVDQVIESSVSLPFADGSFDTVCCIAALNHIPERAVFLHEARRLLSPEGNLILTMLPSGISKVWHLLRSPWDADQHERGMQDGEVYGFSKMEIAQLLDNAGFTIRRDFGFMFGLNRVYISSRS